MLSDELADSASELVASGLSGQVLALWPGSLQIEHFRCDIFSGCAGGMRQNFS